MFSPSVFCSAKSSSLIRGSQINRVTAINYQFAGQTKTVSFGYGKDGQKGESTLLSSATQTVEYDSLGREESSTVGGLTRDISYLGVSGKRTTTLPANLTYTQNNNTLLSTSYTYDERGNIATMTVDGVIYTYTYDSLNQLTGVTGTNGYSASYTYDNGGNITSKTVNGVTTTYGYDTNWKDKLTSYNGQSISYDGMGNPTVSYNKQFMWTGRQLTLAETIDGTLVGYSYNADGIRTQKDVHGVVTDYFVDGSTILAEKTGNNIIWYIYDTGGELLGFTYNGTPYYYLKNQQGDVYKIVDANGTVVGSYTYDPWGKVTATGSMAQINPIRYRSYYYDSETGLYYLQSRYYDPELGRFINADNYPSTGQGLNGNNMFAYCGNNPILRADYGGDIWHIVAGAAIGAAVSFASSIVGDLIAGDEIDWAGAGISAAFGAASGALSATGLGVVAQVAGGAILSGAENAIEQGRENGFDNIDYGDVAVNAVIGGISSRSNGLSKATSNHLNKQAAVATKRISKSVKYGSLKDVGKTVIAAGKYYFSQTKTLFYDDLIDNAIDDFSKSIKYSVTKSCVMTVE